MSSKLHRASFNKEASLKKPKPTNKKPKAKPVINFESLNYIFLTPRAQSVSVVPDSSSLFHAWDGSVLVCNGVQWKEVHVLQRSVKPEVWLVPHKLPLHMQLCLYFGDNEAPPSLCCPPRTWDDGDCVKIYHHCHALHPQDAEKVNRYQSKGFIFKQSIEPQRRWGGPESLCKAGRAGASQAALPGDPDTALAQALCEQTALRAWSCSTAALLHGNKCLLSHCSHHLVPNQHRFKLFHSKNNSNQEMLCQITGRGNSFLIDYLNLATLINQNHLDMRIFYIQCVHRYLK